MWIVQNVPNPIGKLFLRSNLKQRIWDAVIDRYLDLEGIRVLNVSASRGMTLEGTNARPADTGSVVMENIPSL